MCPKSEVARRVKAIKRNTRNVVLSRRKDQDNIGAHFHICGIYNSTQTPNPIPKQIVPIGIILLSQSTESLDISSINRLIPIPIYISHCAASEQFGSFDLNK
jgi:hypothetical protein